MYFWYLSYVIEYSSCKLHFQSSVSGSSFQKYNIQIAPHSQDISEKRVTNTIERKIKYYIRYVHTSYFTINNWQQTVFTHREWRGINRWCDIFLFSLPLFAKNYHIWVYLQRYVTLPKVYLNRILIAPCLGIWSARIPWFHFSNLVS